MIIGRTEDGSVVGADGEYQFISVKRFQDLICESGHCFLCSADPTKATFNDEHVFPRWLLHRHGLFDATLTLPNSVKIPYRSYKVRCCESCNSRLGNEIEEPVSALFRGGHHAITEHLEQEGPRLLFTWLALLFLKTHIRDRSYRWDTNLQLKTGSISRSYDWATFHHAHALLRSFFSECQLGPRALGSLCVVGALDDGDSTRFDYHDLFLAQSLMVRSQDFALITVLDDAGCAGVAVERNTSIPAITGPLSTLQIRELFANFAYTNLILNERPVFATDFSGAAPVILVELPDELRWDAQPPEQWGEFLHALLVPAVGQASPGQFGLSLDVRENIRSGLYSFLRDAEGNFIQNSSPQARPEIHNRK